MKNRIIVLITLLISISSFAQQGINYKALLKDNDGNVLANQDITVRFIIEKPNGSSEYIEAHETTSDANGVFILNIGEGNPGQFHDFDTIDWGDEVYNLEVAIRIEPDGSLIVFDEIPFKTVPYAKHAKHAETAAVAQTANNVTGLEQITENDGTQNNTGWRLIGATPENYGSIGENAVDLSNSTNESSPRGATGESSVALGTNTTASGKYSTAIGVGASASGIYSTALGVGTKSESFASVAIGRNNIGGGFAGVESNPNSYLSWVETDPLFEIGNSLYRSSNALTVLKNGNVGIGRHQPTSLLEVTHNNSAPSSSNLSNAFSIRNIEGESWQFYTQFNGNLHLYNNGTYRGAFLASSGAYMQTSDRKLKKDITPLDNNTLNKVMQLNPVSYLMKAQTDTKRNLGLISQEVQEIFPSLTHYVKESDLITLSYTELIPILIKAIQEQQAIIDTQNSKIDTLSTNNSSLKDIVNNLVSRVEKVETSN